MYAVVPAGCWDIGWFCREVALVPSAVGREVGGCHLRGGLARTRLNGGLKLGYDACSRVRHRNNVDISVTRRVTTVLRVSPGLVFFSRPRRGLSFSPMGPRLLRVGSPSSVSRVLCKGRSRAGRASSLAVLAGARGDVVSVCQGLSGAGRGLVHGCVSVVQGDEWVAYFFGFVSCVFFVLQQRPGWTTFPTTFHFQLQ